MLESRIRKQQLDAVMKSIHLLRSGTLQHKLVGFSLVNEVLIEVSFLEQTKILCFIWPFISETVIILLGRFGFACSSYRFI